MTTHHNTCRAEASIMQRLRDTVPDDEDMITSLRIYKDKIVKFKEHFLFRNHYVTIIIFYHYQCFVFELLGKNLFSEMKENEFQGYDIRTKIRPISY